MSKLKNATPAESIADVGDAIATAATEPDGAHDYGPSEYGKGITNPSLDKESKSEKFIRLATRRVNNALKAIGYVKNLSSRASYEYTAEQAHKVTDALDGAVEQVRFAFNNNKEEKKGWSL